MDANTRHIPVLQTIVLDVLVPTPGESVLDVTLGLGGHAAEFLQATAPDGRLTGLDADEENLAIARERLSKWEKRIELLHCNFSTIEAANMQKVNVVFADLGLSSPHVDDPSRGFTFRSEGPLDLRYDRSSGRSAADMLLECDEEDLASIFRTYGELFKETRRLSQMLAGKKFATTLELKNAIDAAFGFRSKAILPQVFQALRIAVNDELNALQQLLHTGPELLLPGGRMGVISYHSLEDRMVKHAFRSMVQSDKDPVTGKAVSIPDFELLTPKAIVPSEAEIAANPRARSAKFRVIRKK